MTAPTDAIAIVGAGSSTLVGELVAAGYSSIIAIDIAQAALDQLRTNLGDGAAVVQLLRADARHVQLPHPVKLWHDRATFHFLTDPADQKAYAATAARAVGPGGYLVMAEFAPDGPSSCSGLTVARHSVASLKSLFADEFELAESFEQDHTTPSGAVQRFVHVVMIRLKPKLSRNESTLTPQRLSLGG